MRTASALPRLALALVVSVLAGVCLAGLALPLVGGLGLASKAAADQLKPEQPPELALPQRTKILDRDGHVIATLFTENRVPVRLDEVAETARKALIAIEDSRFYEHTGIDVKGTLRALARNSSAGDVQQGGSTLTQQLAKNLRLESETTAKGKKQATEQSVERKLREARYALWLEKHKTKDQILEDYLNIAYYGSGVYGIGAAANHYFSVPAKNLTLAQGALLAGLVQSPSRFDPTDHPLAARNRRNVVLRRMAELDVITPAASDAAIHSGLGLKITTVKSGCEAPGIKAPFFCDYVRRFLEDGSAGDALGKDRQERQTRLLAGGLTIKTTLDPRMQAAAQRAVDDQVPAGDPFGAVAVSDMVEPGTGQVRAMAVDRPFGDRSGMTKVNFALGGTSGFQAGSTFKAFILARALQMGISPSLTLYSPQRYCPKAFPYVAGDGKCGASNAGDSESGTFNMVRATWESVNTYFLQLEERTGLVTPPGLAEALGLKQLDGPSDGSFPRTNPSFVLGPYGVSPLAMAGAYSAFANHGTFCPPRPVTQVLENADHSLDLKLAPCSPVLEPQVADTVTAILRGVIDGNGPRTGGGASIGREAAGKTGTTNESKAAWFVGYTPQLATAVWVGKPTPTPMRRVTINGRYYKQVFGGTIPAAIWKQAMLGALDGVPVETFTPVSLPTATVTGPRLPDVRGQSVSNATDQLVALGYAVVVGAPVDAGPIPAGAVGNTSPAPGAIAPVGSSITLFPSTGVAPKPTTTASPSPTPAPTKGPPPKPTPSATPSPKPKPTKGRP
jgi:membrane peptidoglycan carboxypeptidase